MMPHARQPSIGPSRTLLRGTATRLVRSRSPRMPGSLLKGAPEPRGRDTSENGLAHKVCPDQGNAKRCGALAEWPSRQPNRAPRRGGERGRPVPARLRGLRRSA